MRCVNIQRYVLHIHRAQACVLDQASMAAVQILRQAEQGACDVYNVLGTLVQSSECRTFFARQSLTVKQRRRCHNGNFCVVKAEEIRMFDEVVGMCLVIGIGQKRSNMMQ
jgi:hypothetical protein